MILEPQRLEKPLGYAFESPGLLVAALTHRSAGGDNNERLEFLGDAVLGMVIAQVLFERRPEASEGDLSRLRASLVRKRALAKISAELSLGDYLRLGPGEMKSGGYRRDSILADALEAVLGAVYLDGGFCAARDCILRLFAGRLDSLPDGADLKDAKTRLQEHLQGCALALPRYQVTEVSGKPHAQHFSVLCEVEDLGLQVTGEGSSRRRAEQAAAARMLEALAAREDSADHP